MSGNNLSGRKGQKPRKKSQDQSPEFTARCPVYLSKEAKKQWKFYVKELAGVIMNQDVFALARLCQLRAWWIECQVIINRDGQTMNRLSDRKTEYAAKRPETQLISQYAAEIKQLESKFGLTPKDRTTRYSGRARPNRGSTGSSSIKNQYS